MNSHYAQADLTVDGDCWIIKLNSDEETLNTSAYVRWGKPDEPNATPSYTVYGLEIEKHFFEANTDAFKAIYKNRRVRINSLIEEMWYYHCQDERRQAEAERVAQQEGWAD